MAGYLIYHPKRKKSDFGDRAVYHDSTSGNQDPYIWNRPFLHTFCHITQMTPEAGHINFWVSGDTFPNFKQLYCDLVFVVAQKIYWADANNIARSDSLVESDKAFNDHYQWAMHQHRLKRRRRFTLKADSQRSFQPQSAGHGLIDIIPFLLDFGMNLDALRLNLRAGLGSRPLALDNKLTDTLYEKVQRASSIQLRDEELIEIRRQHAEFGQWPAQVNTNRHRRLGELQLTIAL